MIIDCQKVAKLEIFLKKTKLNITKKKKTSLNHVADLIAS